MLDKTYADFAWEQAAALLAIDSPTGFTVRAAAWVKEAFENLGFAARFTRKGSVLIDLGGTDDENGLLLAAHADTLGAMVSMVKGNGRLKLTPLGGLRPDNTETENVRVYTRDGKVIEGTMQLCNASIHVNPDQKAQRTFDNTEIVLDEDVNSADDTRALGIEVGDIVCFDPRTRRTASGYLKSRFLDDKLSVGILLGFAEGSQYYPAPPHLGPCDGLRGGGPRRRGLRSRRHHGSHFRGHGLRGRWPGLHREEGQHLRQGFRRSL